MKFTVAKYVLLEALLNVLPLEKHHDIIKMSKALHPSQYKHIFNYFLLVVSYLILIFSFHLFKEKNSFVKYLSSIYMVGLYYIHCLSYTG